MLLKPVHKQRLCIIWGAHRVRRVLLARGPTVDGWLYLSSGLAGSCWGPAKSTAIFGQRRSRTGSGGSCSQGDSSGTGGYTSAVGWLGPVGALPNPRPFSDSGGRVPGPEGLARKGTPPGLVAIPQQWVGWVRLGPYQIHVRLRTAEVGGCLPGPAVP